MPLGGDLATAVAGFEPVRRICLRRGVFDVGSINAMQHLTRNPESFVMVLEPVTDDGLRATALTSRMGDEDALRWWVALVREAIVDMHQGATAFDPERRRHQARPRPLPHAGRARPRRKRRADARRGRQRDLPVRRSA